MKKRLTVFALLMAMLFCDVPMCSATISKSLTDGWYTNYSQALVDIENGCYLQAERNLTKSLSQVGNDVGKTLTTLVALEAVFDKTQNLRDKESVLLSHLEILNLYFKPCELQADVCIQLGELYLETNSFANAEKYFSQSVPIIKKCYGDSDLSVGTTLNNLAYSQLRQKKLGNAEENFKAALVVFYKYRGVSTNVFYGLTANNLGDLYEKTNRKRLALIYLEKGSNALSASLGPMHPLSIEAVDRCRNLRQQIMMPSLNSVKQHSTQNDQNRSEKENQKLPQNSPTEIPGVAIWDSEII